MILIPVCTLSPICSSDIVRDFPFSALTVAVDGKQLLPDDGGGGSGGGGGGARKIFWCKIVQPLLKQK